MIFQRIAGFVKNISFVLLSLQGKFLQNKLIKRLGYNPKTSVKGCTVDIKQEAEDKKSIVENEVRTVLKRLKNDPELLVKYIEENDIKIYRIKNAKRLLKLINEEEGFITERHGLKGLFLNIITKNEINFKSDTIIIMNNDELDIYNLIHYFYKWCAMKHGMLGFDEKSQKLLKKFNDKNEDKLISRLSIPEITGLREAIARDVESIDFVSQYSKEHAGAKNALEKIKNDDGASI